MGTRAGSVPGTDNLLSRIDFMAWGGNGCTPAFEVDMSSLDGIGNAYGRCSTVQSVVNRCATSFANGRWWIVDDKDNDVSGKYPALAALLRRPNPLQTWTEFCIQLDTYRALYGEVFVYAVVPVGFGVGDAVALWVINPQNINVELTGKMYGQSERREIVKRYSLDCGDGREELDARNVLHIRDVNQNIGFGPTDIRGESRLAGLEYSVKNIVLAEEALYSLNRDRGAQGILSNESKDAVGNLPLTEEEKRDIQDQYRLKYGLSARQAKVIVTNASLKWQQMTFSVKDLMLFEGINKNIQLLCDAFGYPYELLGNDSGVTYANKLEAKRSFYQDSIIPISKIYAEKFTEFFGLEGVSVAIDYSDVECLRVAEKEQAEAFYRKNEAMRIAYEKGVVSTAEWRLYIGYDEEIYKPDQDNGQDSAEEGLQ